MPGAKVLHLPEREVSDVQGEVVTGGLEHRYPLLEERGQLIGRNRRPQEEADQARLDPPAKLAHLVTGNRGALGKRIRLPKSLAALAFFVEGVDEVGLEADVDLGRGHERQGPLDQADGGSVVLPDRRSAAGGGQAPPGRAGQLVVEGHPELGAVEAGLLEVVAEYLVQLDQLDAVLLQPGCQALVQLGAGRFRQCLVGGVADQQVTETEAVLADELGFVGSDQLLAHERGEAWRHLGLGRGERLDGATVEVLALDRASLEHTALGRIELIQAGGEQGLQGGRDNDLALCFAGHRQHSLDEEWVAARRAHDLGAQLSGDLLRDQLVDVVIGQRLQSECDRPGGLALDELRPRHAEQQDRCARREERDVLE